MEKVILELLDKVVHPESGEGIVKSGYVESVSVQDEKVLVKLQFSKTRDPFATKIKAHVVAIIEEYHPEFKGAITVIIIEAAPKKVEEPKRQSSTISIKNIIAIASGKGGVGKSTITSNLAIAIRDMGFRVGILDADIYGPSQPKMFGVEDYIPQAEIIDDQEYIVPAESNDIKINSIGFFIKPTDALMWRGVLASNALKQLIHQTQWGALDFLLIDLPPGTGDIHLSIMAELNIAGAVIVSTPQNVALADVVRGVEMFKNPQVNVPVLGIVENMAWFTPAELPDNKYYIFGEGGAKALAEQNGIDLLGQVPIIQSIMSGGDSGTPASDSDELVAKYYHDIAEKVVVETMKRVE